VSLSEEESDSYESEEISDDSYMGDDPEERNLRRQEKKKQK